MKYKYHNMITQNPLAGVNIILEISLLQRVVHRPQMGGTETVLPDMQTLLECIRNKINIMSHRIKIEVM